MPCDSDRADDVCPDVKNSRDGYRHVGRAREDLWVPCEECKPDIRERWEARGKTPISHVGEPPPKQADVIQTAGGDIDRKVDIGPSVP